MLITLIQKHSKKHNGSINTKNNNKKFFIFFVRIYKNEWKGNKF